MNRETPKFSDMIRLRAASARLEKDFLFKHAFVEGNDVHGMVRKFIERMADCGASCVVFPKPKGKINEGLIKALELDGFLVVVDEHICIGWEK